MSAPPHSLRRHFGRSASAARLLLAVVLPLAYGPPAEVAAAPTPTPKACALCGDADASGTVDIVDALMTSQARSGLRGDPPCVLQSDVDADGGVTMADALVIAQRAVNLPTTLTCAGCGNGVLDPGEQCDPPAGTCAAGAACSANCGCVACHELCSAGAPLAPGCGACVATVCGTDPACCGAGWDPKCVGEANVLCNAGCATCGNGVLQPGEQCDPPGSPCAGGGTCDAGCACESCAANVCGNGVCEPARRETECNCPADCGGMSLCPSCAAVVPTCGDGSCDPCVVNGESPETCPADCPPCG